MIKINPVVSHSSPTVKAAIREELTILQASLKEEYLTPYSALRCFIDDELYEESERTVSILKQQPYNLVVLIGIGGSTSGALALADSLGHSNDIELMCVDTIEERFTNKQLDLFRNKLKQGNKPLICLITKSGTTPESVINGALFLEVLKEFFPQEYKKRLVVITDEGSPLYEVAHQENYPVVTIPKVVGGRFSVGTAVGNVPLLLLGVDVKAVRRGAAEALRTSLNEALEVNETALTTLALYNHYQEGYRTHNLFFFSPSLVSLGQWYKQLIGESLGKKMSLKGDVVEVGSLPVISLGTTDLHSVAQLYLAGPRNIISSCIFFDEGTPSTIIPTNSISKLIPGMATRSVKEVHAAIVQGTIAAFTKEKRPTIVISLKQTAESMGAFLVHKMVETILLGKLLDINPFDQPAVELYKKETRALLK